MPPPPVYSPNDHSSVEVRRRWYITTLLVMAIEFITGGHTYSSVPTKERLTVMALCKRLNVSVN